MESKVPKSGRLLKIMYGLFSDDTPCPLVPLIQNQWVSPYQSLPHDYD